MSEHLAHVVWERNGAAPGLDYDRSHVWRFDSGVEVPASSAPSFSGDPSRVDPEEAYVASISSCHMLWFLHLAADAGLVVASYSDQAVGQMRRRGRGVMWVSDVELHPEVVWSGASPDPQVVDELHEESHRRCFIANSVRTRITVVTSN